MQFMKSKSITFVLLVTLVMSWTGIAFAFVPATTNVHHLTIQMKTMQEHSSMHKGDTSEHCLTQVKASQKHVIPPKHMTQPRKFLKSSLNAYLKFCA